MPDDLKPKAVLFDLYGTLVDIKTDEGDPAPWGAVAAFLRYRGAVVEARRLQGDYFERVRRSLDESGEPQPDVNVLSIFADILAALGVENPGGLEWVVAQLLRSLTVRRFGSFPEALAVLGALAGRFRLGLISDSQEPYILPELRMASLDNFFETIVISSRYGYRKPDARLFRHALREMNLSAEEVLYVGDSWHRDVVGASNAGVRPVWIRRGGNPDPPPDGREVYVFEDLRGLLSLLRP